MALVECVEKIMTKYDEDNNGYLDRDECFVFLEDYLGDQLKPETKQE